MLEGKAEPASNVLLWVECVEMYNTEEAGVYLQSQSRIKLFRSCCNTVYDGFVLCVCCCLDFVSANQLRSQASSFGGTDHTRVVYGPERIQHRHGRLFHWECHHCTLRVLWNGTCAITMHCSLSLFFPRYVTRACPLPHSHRFARRTQTTVSLLLASL